MSGSGDGSAIHFAFPAKKNGKGFTYKKHGAWLPLSDETEPQEIRGHALTKDLAAELGLPKAMDYTNHPFFTVISDA